MKSVSIIVAIAATVGAMTIDTNPLTNGPISGSLANRSVNNYKVSYPEAKNITGP